MPIKDVEFMIYNNILEAVGGTPMIKLNKMVDKNSADILVKFEGLNIGGSIKTRTALNMIDQAEKCGLINKDKTPDSTVPILVSKLSLRYGLKPHFSCTLLDCELKSK